jgi:hypothetical protein
MAGVVFAPRTAPNGVIDAAVRGLTVLPAGAADHDHLPVKGSA